MAPGIDPTRYRGLVKRRLVIAAGVELSRLSTPSEGAVPATLFTMSTPAALTAIALRTLVLKVQLPRLMIASLPDAAALSVF